MGRTSGLIQAEGKRVTSTQTGDLVTIYRMGADSGQYEPRDITTTNLLAGTVTMFTPASIPFAAPNGTLTEDNTNLKFNDTTNTLVATNIDVGASGVAGTVDIFPSIASRGKVTFSTLNNTGNTTTLISIAAQSAARTYNVTDVGASANFVMSEGIQTINGTKTFGSIICTTLGASSTIACPVFNVGGTGGGFPGTLNILPNTFSTGKISIISADNVGNYTMTITNAPQAAARTYTVPDAGASANFVMTAGAQTIGGAKAFSSDVTVNGNVIANTAGQGLQIKEGSNARLGRVNLVNGAVTVSNTTVTTNTQIFLTAYSAIGTAGAGDLTIGAIVSGTSFDILSLNSDSSVNTGDTRVISWMLVEGI